MPNKINITWGKSFSSGNIEWEKLRACKLSARWRFLHSFKLYYIPDKLFENYWHRWNFREKKKHKSHHRYTAQSQKKHIKGMHLVYWKSAVRSKTKHKHMDNFSYHFLVLNGGRNRCWTVGGTLATFRALLIKFKVRCRWKRRKTISNRSHYNSANAQLATGTVDGWDTLYVLTWLGESSRL